MSERREYGCVFCITGKEHIVAEQIRRACPGVYAFAARREKVLSNRGQKIRMEEMLLPSYVFFEAPADFNPFKSLPRESVIRILCMKGGVWHLADQDRAFAHYLFTYRGLLGFSKAYQEGDRVRVLSGPLKDMEGCIRKIDRRGRSGQVSLTFNGREITAWLGFDLIDPPLPRPTE